MSAWVGILAGGAALLIAMHAQAGELSSELRFDASESLALLVQEETEPVDLADLAGPRFGAEDQWWLTIGGGWTKIFHKDDNYTNFSIGASAFVVEDFEIGIEGGYWYFAQEDEDATGVSAILNFRWHFLTDETEREDWTVFADLGAGVVFNDSDVPENGSDFNFLPRAGIGYTTRLGEGDARLQLGARWQHLSNARTSGGGDNPGRDGISLYAGILFPF